MLKPSDSIYSLKMVKLKKNKLNNFQYIYIYIVLKQLKQV